MSGKKKSPDAEEITESQEIALTENSAPQLTQSAYSFFLHSGEWKVAVIKFDPAMQVSGSPEIVGSFTTQVEALNTFKTLVAREFLQGSLK